MNTIKDYYGLIFVMFFTIGVFATSFMATTLLCDVIW